jgi:poly-gamma-glutamate synthesis protein (capsule biosynthesis protein)
MYQEIKNLAGHVDVVIVSVHAGIEDSPWPSPYIRNLYRSFIDAGATIIHGHHAHVPQGYEEYHNGLILYGMGNFAVDPVKWGSYKNGLWSIGAAIDLNSIPFQWKLITFEIRHNSGSNSISIEESFPEEYERHNKYLELCNRPFHDDLFFDSLWQEVAVRAYFKYGGHYLGLLSQNSLGRIIKSCVINCKSCLSGNTFDNNQTKNQKQLLSYVMLACESHRQMLTTALGVLSGEIKDLRGEESSALVDEMLSY